VWDERPDHEWFTVGVVLDVNHLFNFSLVCWLFDEEEIYDYTKCNLVQENNRDLKLYKKEKGSYLQQLEEQNGL